MALGSKDNGFIADASLKNPSRFSTKVNNSPLHICPPNAGSGYAFSKIRLIPVKNDLGHVNGWLDAMNASSPPSRCVKGGLLDNSGVDLQYRAWIQTHPSALSKFDQIVEVAKGKQIIMFLDYDGTLSPIVEDPDKAFMSESMRNAVKSLASCFPTAIISGRCREKVFEFVGLAELYYAGSHGMDIMGPREGPYSMRENEENSIDRKENGVLFQPASEFKTMMGEVFEILEGIVRKVSGAKIENNKFCISVHFRCVEEEDWLFLAEEVQEVMQSFPTLRLTQGRKVLEIRPSIAWDKGKALEFILEVLGFGDNPDIFPIYIGDDRTDEDAFKVLKQSNGLGILVSTAAKETNALSSLRDTSEVLEFLQCLVSWKQNHE